VGGSNFKIVIVYDYNDIVSQVAQMSLNGFVHVFEVFHDTACCHCSTGSVALISAVQ